MADLTDDFLRAIELHDTTALRAALDAGFNPANAVRGKSTTNWLIEMYTRSDRFAACLRLLLDHGARLDDLAIAPVLLDDTDALSLAVQKNSSFLNHRTNLVSAFTPLIGATPLHVAAEFGHARIARMLLELGADVDARAATDQFGLNGHTPLFHTVNSHANRSEPVMRLLLDAGARTDICLNGINWGKGFDWETTLFDVTPISFAQFGLLPQMHRKETDIAANVRRLLESTNRSTAPLRNIPNRYLNM